MGKVDPATRKRNMTKYRAKPGVREAEIAYGNAKSRRHYATPKGRAYQLFRGARLRAKQRGMVFDLDIDFVLERIISGRCPVLGLPFDLTPTGGKTWFNPLAPSLDRNDSTKGYTKDNVEVVSAWWNIAKGQWSEPFNRMAVRRAAEYFAARSFPWE